VEMLDILLIVILVLLIAFVVVSYIQYNIILNDPDIPSSVPFYYYYGDPLDPCNPWLMYSVELEEKHTKKEVKK